MIKTLIEKYRDKIVTCRSCKGTRKIKRKRLTNYGVVHTKIE